MNNFASVELCKELYKLSKWGDSVSLRPGHIWWKRLVDDLSDAVVLRHGQITTRDGATICPAYDLSYLLQKLPDHTYCGRTGGKRKYIAWNNDLGNILKSKDIDKAIENGLETKADTPEDAACKLAIELFKQEILTRETNN